MKKLILLLFIPVGWDTDVDNTFKDLINKCDCRINFTISVNLRYVTESETTTHFHNDYNKPQKFVKDSSNKNPCFMKLTAVSPSGTYTSQTKDYCD